MTDPMRPRGVDTAYVIGLAGTLPLIDFMRSSALGGGAVGSLSSALGGGAVGSLSSALGGGAVGSLSSALGGGAVGSLSSAFGGGAVGSLSSALGGGAVGSLSSALGGGAVGSLSSALGGGAVGSLSSAFGLNPHRLLTESGAPHSRKVGRRPPRAPRLRCAIVVDHRPHTSYRRSDSAPARLVRRGFARCVPTMQGGASHRPRKQGVGMEPLPPGSLIEYERHARDRMGEFGITEVQIRETLEQPQRIRPARDRSPTEPCMIYLRPIGERMCKVYVRMGSEPMRVATVAWHGQ